MSKIKKSYSLPDEVVGAICRVSTKTGMPESEIVTRSLEGTLSDEVEMTAAERYHFQRAFINSALNSVLRLFGIIEFEGGIQDKFRVALYLGQGNLRGKNREYRNGIIETSLFEILEDIRGWDNSVWKDLTSHMGYFGKIRSRYLNLYPELNKKGRKPICKGNTINNNTTILDSIDSIDSLDKQENPPKTNSVTELKKDLLNKKYPGLDEHGRDIK